MTMRQLLLIPCLAPVLAVLILSVINPGRSISIQILIWRSPVLPLGVWTALAVSAGASIGAGATLLLAPSGKSLRRTLRQPVDGSAENEPPLPKQPDPNLLQRDIRDPAPTVAVPFRIIRQPRSAAAPQASRSSASSSDQARQPGTESDDWGNDIDQDW